MSSGVSSPGPSRRIAVPLGSHMIGRAIHRDGSVRWVQVRARPRRIFDGSIIWDGLILDVTERKRAETEMAEATRKVEEAAKELERSNKELEQFA